LSLPLVLLAQRVRLDRRPRLAVPVHLVGLIGASMCHLALMTTAHAVLGSKQPNLPSGRITGWRSFPSS
jgi:hypothetical protein